MQGLLLWKTLQKPSTANLDDAELRSLEFRFSANDVRDAGNRLLTQPLSGSRNGYRNGIVSVWNKEIAVSRCFHKGVSEAARSIEA